MRRISVLFLAVLLFLSVSPAAGMASGRWITLTEDSLPPDLVFSDDEYTGRVTMTFLGDCTLGGEEKARGSRLGFGQRIAENGLSFPLHNMARLTASDDLTVVNLECVLTDRSLPKVEKEYNFSGPTAYTEILSSAGVECVTLANNHSHDYGDAGYADTKAALEAAGICWFGTDAPAVWISDDGLMVGFVGVSWSLTGNRYKQYLRQVDRLKQAGCSAVITVMHVGTEYSYDPPDRHQEQVVSRAVENGSCLVIGHHPHVVQGVDVIGGVPVVYSLGNCSFGGTTHAKDSDALAVQAVLSFEDGRLTEIALHFHPISITSDERYNNYAPRFLEGNDAERVLEKMRRSTGVDPGTWTESEGAVLVTEFR